MLQILRADLHIHTCLSPCATLDMTPRKIVKEALEQDLAIIAVADHNSAENAVAVRQAAKGAALCVIPGMEVTTQEEVHILALFPGVDEALAMQQVVYDRLMPGQNDENFYGMQVVANADDEVVELSQRLLIGATTLGLSQAVGAIHDCGGLAIASHIDREAFGIIGQLGFVPPGLALDAAEVSARTPLAEARERFADEAPFPLVTSSDAHDLSAIGLSPTYLRIESADWNELRMALAGEDGREIVLAPDSAE